jgi:hypothetical protein
MSTDRGMIDTIKHNLGAKTSAELRDIVQSNDLDRWQDKGVGSLCS